MDINKKELGGRIRSIRLGLGLNMREFGEKIFNSADSLVSRWEKGKSLPAHKRLNEIAKLGNVSVSYILYGTIDTLITDIVLDYFKTHKTFELLDQQEIIDVFIEEYKIKRVTMFYEVQDEYIRQYGEAIDTWELKDEADNRFYLFVMEDLKERLDSINGEYLDSDGEVSAKYRYLSSALINSFESDDALKEAVKDALLKIPVIKTPNYEEKAKKREDDMMSFFTSLYNGKFKHFLYQSNITMFDSIGEVVINSNIPLSYNVNLDSLYGWNELESPVKDRLHGEITQLSELMIMRELKNKGD